MNVLEDGEIYPLAKDKIIMMSLIGGTVETVELGGWALYVGESIPMRKVKVMSENEAINMIIEHYHKLCDSKGWDYEIVNIFDINTHSEIDHMIDKLKAN